MTKNIPSKEYLLEKNRIVIEYPDSVAKKSHVDPYELTKFIPLTQTPNKKLMGGNFFLWIYNLADSSKNNGYNRFLRRIGEPPVMIDTTTVSKIANEMKLFMAGSGYYKNSVEKSVSYKKKKAYVDYKITSNEPYVVDSIEYHFNDTSLKPIILSDTSASYIKSGQLLSRIVMDKERARIASYLEDLGFYKFSTSNVRYVVDTIGLHNRANVKIEINKNEVQGKKDDSKIFRIRNIYINTDYHPTIGVDTVKYDTLNLGALNFIYARGQKRNISPNVIAKAITLYPNLIYSKAEIDYTSENIRNLKYFKTTSILFTEIKDEDDSYVTYIDGNVGDSLTTTNDGYIDCTILCSPAKTQNYRTSFEVSTNSNYTDVSLSLGYGNSNIFKRAESLNINLSASYDFMRKKYERDSYEFGIGASYSIPRLVAPRFISRYRNLAGVSTTIDLSYSSQRRPDYDRKITNLSYGYSWVSNRIYNFTIKPLNVGLINVPWIDSDFLDAIDNPYLKTSYQSQMIFGTLSSFRYTKPSYSGLNSLTLRSNIETSGNFLEAVSNVLDLTEHIDDNNLHYYNIFGVQYSQYVRGDLDVSVKHNFSSNSSFSLVYRIFGGMGVAYGNSSTLPTERMFYVGGSNSMRGWQIRTLGPGNSAKPDEDEYPNQQGNIRLEANIEGRFPVYGPLNGAIFFDVGNVWYNGKGDSFASYEKFKFNSFYKQLGFNTGVGARLDFGYFVLRVDWGIQLHNPGMEQGSRWVVKNFSLDNSAVHFGIGYPF